MGANVLKGEIKGVLAGDNVVMVTYNTYNNTNVCTKDWAVFW